MSFLLSVGCLNSHNTIDTIIGIKPIVPIGSPAHATNDPITVRIIVSRYHIVVIVLVND